MRKQPTCKQRSACKLAANTSQTIGVWRSTVVEWSSARWAHPARRQTSVARRLCPACGASLVVRACDSLGNFSGPIDTRGIASLAAGSATAASSANRRASTTLLNGFGQRHFSCWCGAPTAQAKYLAHVERASCHTGRSRRCYEIAGRSSDKS